MPSHKITARKFRDAKLISCMVDWRKNISMNIIIFGVWVDQKLMFFSKLTKLYARHIFSFERCYLTRCPKRLIVTEKPIMKDFESNAIVRNSLLFRFVGCYCLDKLSAPLNRMSYFQVSERILTLHQVVLCNEFFEETKCESLANSIFHSISF